MAKPAPPFEDRARGALLGLAVGDALGAPLVGMGREQARIKHAVVESYLGGGLYLLGPGENTARVQMVRAAAVALLEEPPSRDRLLAGYVRVMDSGVPGLGEATRASLERIQAGMEPDQAARETHDALERRTAGVGPALRAVPYALRYRDDPERLIASVLADAALTHADARAGAAAVALALWVREHLVETLDGQAALDRVRDHLAARPELPDVLPGEAAVGRVDVRATAFGPDVLHVVARHAASARSARRAIVDAVNEAGQAAALGAATGAVVGARFGESGLPDRWTSLLVGARAWRAMADRLVAAPGANPLGGHAAPVA
ncbi:MAG: ADP-ribosylglycohydrolase family protein [Planctomycetota bacterium]|jgi:ADP-ribosyl-[dinitrogen reductase] hydrolase